MVHWNISPHPIADVRDWSAAGRLELQPDFQRREVWTPSAKIMLIDSILSDIPLPKIFLAKTIKSGSVHRVVIDGQQRILAILGFLRDEFTLVAPYDGPHAGKKFSDLTEDEQNEFLRYRIDFNEADNPSDREVRNVYMRVNKYTVPLTRQELRRADYPGDFLSLSEEFSVLPFFEDAGIFTATDRRRYADAEYVSEIITALLGGIQDKKTGLDKYYIEYARWKIEHKKATAARFKGLIDDIAQIFAVIPGGLKSTRFRQKADFYSLCIAIDELKAAGFTINGKDLSLLSEDIRMLDFGIAPESDVAIFREYAIKCVSQANSASSRRWRADFLKAILSGTYQGQPPTDSNLELYFTILEDLDRADGSDVCPPLEHDCPICDQQIVNPISEGVVGWARGEVAFQISNATWLHDHCRDATSAWRIFVNPKKKSDDQPDLL